MYVCIYNIYECIFIFLTYICTYPHTIYIMAKNYSKGPALTYIKKWRKQFVFSNSMVSNTTTAFFLD